MLDHVLLKQSKKMHQAKIYILMADFEAWLLVSQFQKRASENE